MAKLILAIDPGYKESAYCSIDAETFKPIVFDKVSNEELMRLIRVSVLKPSDGAAIEMIQNLGMGAVGQEIFDTTFWVGRYYEAILRLGITPGLVYRKQEKRHICGSDRAKDANIRTALIDRFAQHDAKNGKGTKAEPDWFYGFRADIWAAYAVAITYAEGANKGGVSLKC